jgi:hypothetical protein
MTEEQGTALLQLLEQQNETIALLGSSVADLRIVCLALLLVAVAGLIAQLWSGGRG